MSTVTLEIVEHFNNDCLESTSIVHRHRRRVMMISIVMNSVYILKGREKMFWMLGARRR